MRLGLAIRAFFAALSNAEVASRIKESLDGKAASAPPPAAVPVAAAPQPAGKDALLLLAALQREARFVDIVKEPLTEYSDAQVGAAARDVLRDCGAVLDRCFGLEAAVDADEGATVETPVKVDPAAYRLTGKVEGQPPYRGIVVHHGWKAIRYDLPQFSGSAEAAMCVAPVEIEV